MKLYKAILAQYGSAVAGGLGSFSEMGYLLGKFFVQAVSTVKPPYTIANVNAAIKALKDQNTDLLCQPWVYGNYPLHIPNNSDFTTTPDNGKMVTAQGCTRSPDARSTDRGLPQGRGNSTFDESAQLLDSRDSRAWSQLRAIAVDIRRWSR